MTPRALFHPARLARRPVLSTQSDERLVDLVRAGSDPAFEAIVERYRRALMRYVSRLLPPERAEDVVQQSFVKAYEAMHKGSAELHLRPWLYRIAHNGALNALRDRALGHAQLTDGIDGVERPDQALERVQSLRELVVAVQALPERQRDAILLRELEGRSYEEIATALGVTDGAVRQLLNRARNTLRAAAASLVPVPLVERVAGAESADPIAGRVAELVGVGGSAIAMKLCATVLVTGAVVGGTAMVPDVGRDRSNGPRDGIEDAQAAEDPGDEETEGAARAGTGPAGGGQGAGRAGGGSGQSGRRAGDDDARDESRSGHDEPGDGGRDGEREPGEREHSGRLADGHSGPGGGGSGGDDGHSGPGGGGSRDDDGHSGPGGSGGGGGGGDLVTEPRDGGVDGGGDTGDHSGPGGGGADDVAEPAGTTAEGPTTDNSGPGGGGDDLPDP
jgi:RNA polymerase sigma factor (sigma-70 family)